jgi:alkanesulfonate monooxygenase SsuD/methylene tetrahydromethanopterin reductase-like flavin-dependent oxidoreductase (luciferase family)
MTSEGPDRTVMGCGSPSRSINSTRPASTRPAYAITAGCTERLRLGVAVLVSSLHDPLQLASAITAVDRLSHGRLDVGVAPGGGRRRFAAFGVDDATFRFGGQAPKALARAVRHGDAFLGAGSSTTAKFAEAVSIVQRELASQGKDPAHFPIGKRVYLMIDNDPAKARQRVLDGLHRIYGGMPGIDDVPVSGSVDDVVGGLRGVIDAGAQTILLNPVGRDVAEDREQMERLAAEVIPQLR